MLRKLSPARLAGATLILLAVVVALLWLIPSGSYLYLPNEAEPVAPLVEIGTTASRSKRARDGGGIYFVSVGVNRASILESLLPRFYRDATLVPAEHITPPGVSAKQLRTEGLRKMARSQEVAAAVALRALGYKVVARPIGALVSGIAEGAPAVGKLEPTEIIVAVDGTRVRTPDDLRRLVSKRRPGDKVRLGVHRGARLHEVELETIADPDDPKRPIVGVFVEQAAEIKLPLRVRIDAGDIAGPSAGLAFALDVLEELGRDVDHGYRVAVTGELDLDGSIAPVGGIKQKAIGARQADADVFVVPAGENAREARRHAEGLRVIPVGNFEQALRALATLPKKR